MDELNFPDKFLKVYQKDEVIFHEGDSGSQMYVINAGQVNIAKSDNGTQKFLKSLGKGEIFGEMALVDNLPRSASVSAAEDNTHLLEIDHALFVYLVGQQPAFALIILKAMSHRLRSQGIPGIPEKHQPVAPQSPGMPSSAAKGNGVVQLKENIFQFRGQCMSYLIRGAKKNLLIDTGLPWESEILEGQLASVGLLKEDIHIVVLTHEHLDHIGCVPIFSPRTIIAAHSLAANKIALQDEFVLMSKAFHLNVEEYHIDFHLHHGTFIDLGGAVLQVLHTPGHSSGSICLYEAGQQVLFTGDTIFTNGVLGGIFPSGSISDYALTLRQLSTLRIKELYPGHGRISATPEEDFAKAIKGSVNLVHDTSSLFSVLDSQEEFAQVAKAISTYAKRV
ncbi:MAG: MBL fold metallo-hydrolase [Desulfuromonadales bacterium]|nr:MBL fold metallo-hydrolase [Desulfuromonadales bacterium]